jgi:hypothetical protein
MMEPAGGAADVAAAQGMPPTEPGPARRRWVEDRITRARAALVDGDRAGARDSIESAVRAGLWQQSRLWTELLSLMDRRTDYGRFRSLWWDSPDACHRMVSLLRIMARAASVAGEHDEARTLLRAAILAQAARRRRVRAVLGRAKRRALALLPGRPQSPGRGSFADRAATALTDLDRDLGKLGVRPFLISGTLLGYARESGFISWDKDIDVGVFAEVVAPAALERVFHRSPDFHVRRLDFNTDRLRVHHTNGVMIDIFPHYRDGAGRLWHDGTATRWWNTPFEVTPVEFLGRTQFVPLPPERYLTENYGDWRVPVKHFDARLDAPNVEVTDRDYFDTLLYFSLLDAVGKGNSVGRRRYTDLLRERGEGEWLDRL